jgi:hypothetical protein
MVILDDILWPHFQPLWRDLFAASSTNILVAGGYGLFLKQRWLSSSASLPTVVPIPNWLDATPRVTKDVDLVLGLDLIKDASHQKSVVSALTQNGFEASDRESERRWKFLKRLRRPEYGDSDMRTLQNFAGIVAADLGDTIVTDNGIPSLIASQQTLQYLFLWGTKVGDGIVKFVEDMPSLRMLNISTRFVDPTTFSRVCERLPECYVIHQKHGRMFRGLTGDDAMQAWLSAPT